MKGKFNNFSNAKGKCNKKMHAAQNCVRLQLSIQARDK